MTGRPEPGLVTIKTLFALSGNVCAFKEPRTGHSCEVKLTDPSWPRVRARICHIHGFAPGSVRYDALQTDAERNAFENLLLLCPNHHVEVDDLRSAEFSPEVLQDMKKGSERERSNEWISGSQLDQAAASLLIQMRPAWQLLQDLALAEVELAEARASLVWFEQADADPASDSYIHSDMKLARGKVHTLVDRCNEIRRLLKGDI